MKFLLDGELEKVARWLRILGQDVEVLPKAINKRDILENADRVFVTTSRKWETHLKSWKIDYFILPKERWETQLCMLIKFFTIEPTPKLDICIHCNTKLLSVDRETIKEKLPLLVYQFAYDFTFCPKCNHVYWKGSHYEKIKRKLKEIVKAC